VNNRDLILHLTTLLSSKDEQIASLSRQIELLNQSLNDNQKETNRIVSQLSNEIKKLTKQLYGSKSEKLSNLKLKPSTATTATTTPEKVVDQQEVTLERPPVVEKAKQTKPPRRVYSGLEERVIILEPLEDTTGARIVREEEVSLGWR